MRGREGERGRERKREREKKKKRGGNEIIRRMIGMIVRYQVLK